VPIDDQAVLCPHCGAAQIPQMSKTELSRHIAGGSDRGFVWKVVLGVVGLTVLLFLGPWLLERFTNLGASLPWLSDAGAVLAVLVILGGMFWVYFHHKKAANRAFGELGDPQAKDRLNDKG
jgi:hypothetical protein